MTLAEALAQLMAEPDRKVVVKGLQDSAHSIYQDIFDAGHGAATATAQRDIARLTGELTTAKNELKTAEDRLKDGSGADAFKRRETEYQTEISGLKQQLNDAKTANARELKGERLATKLANLEAKLVALHVDPDYAKVLIERQANKDRIDFNDDGSLKVLQAGKTIPYAPSDGKDALDLMAADLVASTPAKFILAPGDRGSGQGGGSAAGGGGGSGYLAELKANLVKQREAEAKSGIESLDERLARR